MKTLSRWSLAFLLLPLVWATIRQIFLMGSFLEQEGFHSWWLYLVGGVVYLAVERMIKKPMWLYVVGHELTHAISSLMSGAQVHSFKATSKGGEVRLSKSNVFIALSPYIVPIYAILIIAIYALTNVFYPRPEITWAFRFLLGSALAFHLSLTFSAFHKHQSDLKVVGFFLSGVLIALGNSLIVGVLGVTLFTKTPTFKDFSLGIAKETTRVWWAGIKIMAEQVNKQVEKTAWTR